MLHRLGDDEGRETGCDGCKSKTGGGWFWCARVGSQYRRAFLCDSCAKKVREATEEAK